MSSADRAVSRRAHAKINLFLRVEGRRADGYHDIESLILPISLHDEVTVRQAEAGARTIAVTGDARLVQALSSVPADENLASRALTTAAKAWPDPDGVARGAAIELTKRIPVAAGLGGGSADAAATLAAANDLWGAGADAGQMHALATSIGSDVPAMQSGGSVLVRGRGEHLTPVHVVHAWWVIKPLGFPVSARDAYAWWDERPLTGPDAGALIAAAEAGDLELVGHALFNDLQPAVIERHPSIAQAIDGFKEAGALGAIMSGSGPTVAALASHLEHAETLSASMPGSIVVSGPPAPDDRQHR